MRTQAKTRTTKPRQPIRILNTEARPRMESTTTAAAPAAIEDRPAIRIDAGFQRLMPPPSADELAQLEANLVADGCRDPLVTWDGILIDGHNRHAICERLGIPYRTVALAFADRAAVEEWIIRHQFGRRNLPPLARIELATKLEAIYAERAKENLKTYRKPGEDDAGVPLLNSTKALDTPDRPPLLNSTKAVHARERAAREAGVSESTYREGKAVLESAPAELVDRVKRGEVSIHAAYTEVRPKPAGQCRVNGVLVPDTPDVARARKAGRIGPDVIPDVEDPGDGDETVTFTEDAEDAPAAQTDEEWFATLPVWHQLGPGARVLFERDALAYRACEEARGKFAHAVRSVLASANRKGSLPTFCHRLRGFLKINHPKHWSLCPAPEHGGCGGRGVLDITGTCTRCHGGGYQI